MNTFSSARWWLVLAGMILGGANFASAQTALTPSAIFSAPNTGCENLQPPNYNCPSCGESGAHPQCIGHVDGGIVSDNLSPFGVAQSMSQGFCKLMDSGVAPLGAIPGGCSACGAGGMIPAASRMIRFELARIWRSTWTHDGSLGQQMYTGYDYYVTHSASLIEIDDPNTGFIEQFQLSGGSSWAPVGQMTYGSSASYSSSGSLGHVTIVQPGGTTLNFDETSYAPLTGSNRCRLNSIADRNGNKLAFSYTASVSSSDDNALRFQYVTDPYGGTTTFSYTTATSDIFSGHLLLGKVAFSDSRAVQYQYGSENYYSCQQIDYLDVGGGTTASSYWHADSGGPYTVQEALLPADHFNWQVFTDSTAFGRVRAIMRSNGESYAYARNVTVSGGTTTILTWDQGKVQQVARSPSQQYLSSQFQLSNGTWEAPVTFSSSNAYAPTTRYVEPALTGGPAARTTNVARDPLSNMVTQRTYPDGGVESFVYNSFDEPTLYVDQLGNSSSWTYDGSGNMRTHVVAPTTSVSATESWTYSSGTPAPGAVLSHTDFKGNVTNYSYLTSSSSLGSVGELYQIALPGGSMQPSGTITFTYYKSGRVATVTDPINRQVTFCYDPLGRLVKTIYPDTSTEIVTYNSGMGSLNSAQVGSTTDRNGNVTDYTYYSSLTDSTSAAYGMLQSVLVKQGTTATVLTTTTKGYDSTTLMETSSLTDGNETDHSYDYLNRVATTIVRPSLMVSLTASNTYNRYWLLQSADYYNRATTFTYDDCDRPLSQAVELTPGGSVITPSTSYSKSGLVLASFDGNNNQTQYLYDQRNRPIATIYAVGVAGVTASTSLGYDANSNVTSGTDEMANAWTKTYSVRDQVLTSVDAATDTTRYCYTADALVASMTNANNHVTGAIPFCVASFPCFLGVHDRW